MTRLDIRRIAILAFGLGILTSSAVAFGQEEALKCSALVASAQRTNLRLFGNDPVFNSLKLSERGSIPNGTQAEAKLLTPYAQKGLREAIADEGGARKILDLLVRLGMVNASVTDPYYSELVLATENRDVNLHIPHRDRVVDKFLSVKRLAKKAEMEGVSPILRRAPERERNNFLYWQILFALDKKIRDQDTDSRDAVNALFTELGRLDDYVKADPTLDRNAIRDRIFDGLRAEATYIPKKLELWEPLSDLIGEIPFAAPVLALALDMYTRVFQANRAAQTKTMDPGKSYFWREQVEDTYRLGFVERDPFMLQKNAETFIKRYLDSQSDLFSPEFARNMELAYPELRSIRHRAGVAANSVGVNGSYITEGSFGPGTFEGYKVMNRAALAFALVRGDKKAFPKLSDSEFQDLRKKFLSDTKILVDEKVSPEAFDRFQVYLILDCLGRGRSEFLDELGKLYALKETVGTDYERRSAVLLEKYRLAAHSFARLADTEQADILRWFDHIYNYSTGQILQLEGGRFSFARLEGVNEEDLAALYYRSILSFSALPGSPAESGSSTLDSGIFQKWDRFRQVAFGLVRRRRTADESYDEYLKWVGQQLRLPVGSPRDVTVLRLASQARVITSTEAHQVAVEFDLLDETEKAVLTKFSNSYPVLGYGVADLFTQILVKNQRQNVTKNPYLLAMKTLARAYQTISRLDSFQTDLIRYPSVEKRVNVRYLVDFVIKNDLDQLQAAKMIGFKLDDSYQVEIER